MQNLTQELLSPHHSVLGLRHAYLNLASHVGDPTRTVVLIFALHNSKNRQLCTVTYCSMPTRSRSIPDRPNFRIAN